MTRVGSLKSCSSSSALITCQQRQKNIQSSPERKMKNLKWIRRSAGTAEEEHRASGGDQEEEKKYLTLAQVRSDSGRVNSFYQQHPEVIQLQPAEVIFTHSLHPAVLLKVLTLYTKY
ncbi:hypothetical protein GOODEAATRI_027455 [Goodea atripinnis]|uniref:Uncharacterized protein n=1 Tax=Goodea atripinnis TaxID=208336 RepID=A0ABV0NY59_9TELE